jgi:hypothetical protein
MRSTPLAAWLSQVQGARSEDELVRVIKEYLASWTPDELARLPEECQPRIVDGRDDVLAWAVVLARGDLKFSGDPLVAAQLHELATLFTAAGMRLPRLGEDGKGRKS